MTPYPEASLQGTSKNTSSHGTTGQEHFLLERSVPPRPTESPKEQQQPFANRSVPSFENSDRSSNLTNERAPRTYTCTRGGAAIRAQSEKEHALPVSDYRVFRRALAGAGVAYARARKKTKRLGFAHEIVCSQPRTAVQRIASCTSAGTRWRWRARLRASRGGSSLGRAPVMPARLVTFGFLGGRYDVVRRFVGLFLLLLRSPHA